MSMNTYFSVTKEFMFSLYGKFMLRKHICNVESQATEPQNQMKPKNYFWMWPLVLVLWQDAKGFTKWARNHKVYVIVAVISHKVKQYTPYSSNTAAATHNRFFPISNLLQNG